MKKLLLAVALFAASAQAQNYYLGPWVWKMDSLGGAWHPPDSSVTWMDLRSYPQRATRGPGPGGVGFFQTTETLGAPYVLVGTGNIETSRMDNFRRNNWMSKTGYRPEAATLSEALWGQLTEGSDPSGRFGVKSWLPDSKSNLRLVFGDFIRSEPFKFGEHPHSSKVEQRLQLAYREMVADVQAGRVPADLPGKVLDMWVDQFGIAKEDRMLWSRLVPPDLRADAVLVPHATTITESFNGADSDTVCVDLTCTEVDGDWDRVSNKAQLVTDFGSQSREFRADSDLSSGNMYAQIVVDNESGTLSFVSTNFSSSAEDFYAFGVSLNHPASGTWQIWEVAAGVRTSLAVSSGTDTSGAGVTFYGEYNGGNLDFKVGGVSKLTASDSTYGTNVRCGNMATDQTGVTGPEFDSLECGDIGSPPADPTVIQVITVN